MNEIYILGAIVKPLCLWFEKNRRSMPWRDAPTPYHVWLSEIMLQQTRIEAVKEYYKRFVKRLPDVEALAGVSEEELMKLWEGLGYYNRARNLKKAAEIMVERYQGKLPADYDLLMELPGIGNYTAGAVASIAYRIPTPAVDGNVLRVTMRYLNCRDDISKMSVRRKMERSIMDIIPKEAPGEFNQALMELGEVICIPNGMPLCNECPLQKSCRSVRKGTQMELPVKPEKKARRKEKRTLTVYCYKDKVGICKRPEKGLLAGLWEFPSTEGHLTKKQMKEKLEAQGIPFKKISVLEQATHVFSHIEWNMKGYRIELQDLPFTGPVSEICFVSRSELENIYTLPVAFHSFFMQIM